MSETQTDAAEVWKSVVGYEGLYEVSKMYGVKQSAISKVQRGISWRHVP